MRTARLLAIIAVNSLIQAGCVISERLAEAEVLYQTELKEQKRRARLKGTDIPDWTRSLFEGNDEKSRGQR